MIPNIVAREDIVVANTLSSTTWSVNLMLGATAGGIVAALLGRDAVFLLNALSFVVSAALIWGMRFAEPHAEGGHRFPYRELVDFSPILAGIRYVRSQVRLRATIFVKFGNLIIGPSWVLFTVMGQKEFAVHWHGLDPARGRVSRHEPAAGRARTGRTARPGGRRSLGRTRERRRLERAIFWAIWQLPQAMRCSESPGHLWQACLCVMLAHLWRFRGVGVFDNAAAIAE